MLSEKEIEELKEKRYSILLKVRKFLMKKKGSFTIREMIEDEELDVSPEEIEHAISRLEEIAIIEGGGPKTIKSIEHKGEKEYYF